ncbi:MAG: FAD-binding oxidoreductase [Acidimicrobiales bacterium]
MNASDLVSALRSTIGDTAVLTGADAEPAFTDWRKVYSGSAICLVRPNSTEQVSDVMRICHDAGICVVPQGGNTGMSGGATPSGDRPTIVLSLMRMNQIESVDKERYTITTQAGVSIQDLHEAAASVDRLFAPDWGARGSATIGGGMSTNAGGNNVLRYGNMRDQIMGLEVVLPDGRVWNGLRALRKDSSGYDLKQLFIGAEGTLGIVTRATVKLHPPTPNTQSALAALTSLDNLGGLFDLAREYAAESVTAFELVPNMGLTQVCKVFDLQRPISTIEDFYVLIKVAAAQPVTDMIADFLSAAANAGLISDAIVAGTQDQEDRLWMIRDELSPSGIYQHHAVGLKMDIAVPIDKIADYHDGVSAIASKIVPRAYTYGFGHIGDGNLHMMVMPFDDDYVDEFVSKKPELIAAIDEATFALGGTLSAEHGIGQELRARIGAQKSDLEWEMMRSIKAMFDPDGRMNPGKLFPPS